MVSVNSTVSIVAAHLMDGISRYRPQALAVRPLAFFGLYVCRTSTQRLSLDHSSLGHQQSLRHFVFGLRFYCRL